MCRACGPPFLVNVLLICGTLYLTIPILVHFLGLGALFNESVLPNFLNVFSVIMFYVFLYLCVTVEITLLYLVSLYLVASRLI